MSIRYYKLFDLLNRRGMKKSDLRKIISSATVAKLSKGEYISGEAIEKICLFLGCQPGDIMEVVKETSLEDNTQLISKDIIAEEYERITINEEYIEQRPGGLSVAQADELLLTERDLISTDKDIL